MVKMRETRFADGDQLALGPNRFHILRASAAAKGRRSKVPALPKGLKAAAPIRNRKLRELLMGPDITTSGGTHTVSNGKPVLKRDPHQ